MLRALCNRGDADSRAGVCLFCRAGLRRLRHFLVAGDYHRSLHIKLNVLFHRSRPLFALFQPGIGTFGTAVDKNASPCFYRAHFCLRPGGGKSLSAFGLGKHRAGNDGAFANRQHYSARDFGYCRSVCRCGALYLWMVWRSGYKIAETPPTSTAPSACWESTKTSAWWIFGFISAAPAIPAWTSSPASAWRTNLISPPTWDTTCCGNSLPSASRWWLSEFL